jgi:hypothetical protein
VPKNSNRVNAKAHEFRPMRLLAPL